MLLDFWLILFALFKLIGLTVVCIIVMWAMCELIYEWWKQNKEEKESDSKTKRG